nr:maturase K [Hymenophyllum coreanum]
MKTGYRFLSKFEKLRERKGIDPSWEYFLYSLLFQDDLYSIAYNSSSNKLRIDSIEEANISEGYSIISIKRLINAMRQEDLSGVFSPESDSIRFGLFKDFYFDALLRGICSVLEIVLSRRIEPLLMREISEWKSSRSSHSVFPFMEDRFVHSNYVLETKMPYNLHSEVSIRIFRRQIKDAPFLHLSRLIFHRYTNSRFSLDYPVNSLAILVWNFYMYEIESLVVPLWKQFSCLQFEYLIDILDQNNILRKENHVARVFLNTLNYYSNLTRNLCIHYGRYKNHSIVILKGTNYSAKGWIYYFLKLGEFHSHRWFHCHRICLRILLRNRLLFLGYILSVQSRINKVRVGTIRESYITVSIINDSFFRVPILFLIKSMAKEGFCDSSGRLVSRSAWTTLTDDDILRRFIQVWKILSIYYSGLRNREKLYRLRYILKFSCGKTLACKHKSTTRMIRRRFDLRIFLRTFSLSGDSKLSSSFQPNEILKNQRFWYLEITQFSLLL